MKRALLLLVLAGGSTLLTAGCATVIPEPTMEMAGGDATSFETLREGRRLYVAKCSSCHALIAPGTRTDDVWREEVDEMLLKKKIRMAPGDREKLLAYLTAAN